MWYSIKEQQVFLFVFAKPNAKKTFLVQITNEALHISVKAKPQDGAANRELIEFLAILFKLPKSSIVLHRGDTSRHKSFRLPLTQHVEELLTHPETLMQP